MRLVNVVLSGMLLCVLAPANAVQPATGDIAAAGCAGCHGDKGQGNAEKGFPALAQLPVPYFTKQLADFRSGARTPIKPLESHDFRAASNYDYYVSFMRAAAKGVSPQDAEALGAYYARQPRPALAPAEASAEALALGRKIATEGAWDRDVPPCFKCHATNGVGVAPAFPPIAGQHPAYTARQLRAWKAGTRSNDPQKLMSHTAGQLTEDEIQAVATYLATLEIQPSGAKK